VPGAPYGRHPDEAALIIDRDQAHAAVVVDPPAQDRRLVEGLLEEPAVLIRDVFEEGLQRGLVVAFEVSYLHGQASIGVL
jgi:hypothetical protein